MNAPTLDAVRFFYRHAGYGYDPTTETERRGRVRCAVSLATAERWARDQDAETEWADDWDLGTSHREFYGDAYSDGEPETCERCLVTVETDRGTFSDGVGCVDGATAEYRRVVAAECAAECLAQYETAPEPSLVFTVRIECDNAAFHDCGPEIEISTILRTLANRVEPDGLTNGQDATDGGPIRDTNGNTCGSWALGTVAL